MLAKIPWKSIFILINSTAAVHYRRDSGAQVAKTWVGQNIGLVSLNLDTERLVLSREGQPIRLQPQPAPVFSLRVENSEPVVWRDELSQAIWGRTTFVDFEHGLNYWIAQIRFALGTKAQIQHTFKPFQSADIASLPL